MVSFFILQSNHSPVMKIRRLLSIMKPYETRLSLSSCTNSLEATACTVTTAMVCHWNRCMLSERRTWIRTFCRQHMYTWNPNCTLLPSMDGSIPKQPTKLQWYTRATYNMSLKIWPFRMRETEVFGTIQVSMVSYLPNVHSRDSFAASTSAISIAITLRCWWKNNMYALAQKPFMQTTATICRSSVE